MEVPLKTSGPAVCLGCVAVRKTALERKGSAPPSEDVKSSACRALVPLMIVTYSRNGARGWRE